MSASFYLLRVHHPNSPESVLAELRASLMANRTLMDTSMAGSPVASKEKIYAEIQTVMILGAPFDDITPIGFLDPLSRVTLKSWGMSLAAGGL